MFLANRQVNKAKKLILRDDPTQEEEQTMYTCPVPIFAFVCNR
jgi:hypothetical protein